MNEESKERLKVMFEYRKTLKTIFKDLKIYDKSAKSYTFIQECYNFIESLKQERIKPSALSEKDEAYQELKYIITNLYPIETKQDNINKALSKMNEMNFNHIYLYPSFIKYEDQMYYDLLIKKGAKELQIKNDVEKRAFYFALNKKEEIEGCAQYIINNDLISDEVQITLANQEYLPLLKQIFDRYEIPYSVFCHDAKSSICAKRFVALLQYYIDDNTMNLMQCLNCGVFQGKYVSKLQEYLKIFEGQLSDDFDHLQYLQLKSHLVSDLDIKRLTKIEEEALIAKKEIEIVLNELKVQSSIEDVLLKMIDIVNESLSTYSVEVQVLDKIVDLLKDAIDEIKDHDDLSFLMIAIDNLTYTLKVDEVKGVAITSLTQGRMYRKDHFIVGVDNKNFPAFPNKKGIFDEAYYVTTPYSSQQQRYEYYVNQVEKILDEAQNLIVSYSIAGYDGKGKEAALEIESRYPNKEAYPLKQIYHKYPIDPRISADSAKALYLNNGVIKGSISSLEKYVNCPFAYFTRYGLGINEPIQLGFSPSYMGKLSHYVMERLTKEKDKQYPKTTIDELSAIIQEEILALWEIFPQKQALFEFLNKRITNMLEQFLVRMNEYEKHSSAIPCLQEANFNAQYELDHGVILMLEGIIDRIDQLGSDFVIFDYKSSGKSISLDEFRSGKRLQLVTYSVNVEEQMGHRVLGSYYMSFKNENITQDAYKANRRGKITIDAIDEDTLYQNMLKHHKLKGWSFDELAIGLDDDGTHIDGFNNKGQISDKKLLDLKKLKQDLEVIFNRLVENILDGKIPIEPSEEACAFCRYSEICHTNGEKFEKINLIEEGGGHSEVE